jgi:hypothetical protein
MAERLRPRHIILMVAIIAVASVLTPVAVGAISGTVVNLADRTASYYARVDNTGALRVQPADAKGSLLATGSMGNATGAVRDVFAQGTGVSRLAITELTVAFDNGGTSTSFVKATFIGYSRTSGSGTCANVEAGVTTGFASSVLRVLLVPAEDTLDLTFANKPLLLPGVAAGQPWCLRVDITNPGTIYAVYYGITAYTV